MLVTGTAEPDLEPVQIKKAATMARRPFCLQAQVQYDVPHGMAGDLLEIAWLMHP